MIVSLALFSAVAYTEQSNYTKMGIHPVRNIMSLALFAVGFIFFVILHNILASDGTFMRMVQNPLFWFFICMDVPAAFIKRKNFQYNYMSLTSISGAMQLSFVFLPVISWIVSDVLGVASPVPSLFRSNTDLLLYSVGVGLYLVFYLRHKIELNHVTSLFFLILTPLWMSFSMYPGVVIMQVESPAAPFIIVSFINMLMFGVMALRSSEFAFIEKKHVRDISIEVLKSLPTRPIALYLGATLAAELFVVLKRIAQLSVSIIMDGLTIKNLRSKLHDVCFVAFVLIYTAYWFFAA